MTFRMSNTSLSIKDTSLCPPQIHQCMVLPPNKVHLSIKDNSKYVPEVSLIQRFYCNIRGGRIYYWRRGL